MTAHEIFETIREAFGSSTLGVNRFERALRSIRWNGQYEADGEYYFNADGVTFVTTSLNPFEIVDEWRRPTFMFEDGSVAYI